MEQNQNLREKILSRWARWAVENWGKALLIALAITIAMGFGIARLKMEMTFYSILPDRSNQIRDLKEIVEDFPYASGILLVVDGRDIEDPQEAESAVKNGLDVMALEFEKETYKPYISSVIGKMDMSLFKEHGLMLTKPEDLKRLERTYSDLNLVPLLTHINDDFEAEYSGNEEKLADEEQAAVNQFKGLDKILKLIEKAAAGGTVSADEVDSTLEAYLVGESYIMSNDNRMGLMIIQPTFTINDIIILRDGVNAIEEAAKNIAGELDIKAGLTGMTTIARDEMVTSEQGLVGSTMLAFIMILLLLILVFRMFSVPFIAGIPLITGILWTVGLSGFVIHRLNIMTAMYIVALLGLGIDYAIHLLSGFIQERDAGVPFKAAARNAMIKSGSGITTGALTTAAAFFTLTIAKTGLIKELGIVAGMGILCELAAMIILIPPLLAAREYRLQKKGKKEHKLFSHMSIKSDAARGIGKLLVKMPILFTVVMLLIGIGFGLKARDVSIEKNLLEMEAKGLESVHLNDEMIDEFGMAPDGLLIISRDLDEVRTLTTSLKKLSSVKSVDSLSDFYVSDQDEALRIPVIVNFTEEMNSTQLNSDIDYEKLLDELYRLESNLIEMGDLAYLGNMDRIVHTLGDITGINDEGDKVAETCFDRLFKLLSEQPEDINSTTLNALQGSIFNQMRERLNTMADIGKVSLDMLPENLQDSFISRDGTAYLLSINPTQNPWEGDFRDIFTDQVESVTDKGTGMILAGDQMTIMAEEDGIRASILAVIVVFLIMLIDFKNLKLTILTMIPLLLSFFTLFGFMAVTGIKFDFLNIIVVPLLIGIGIDNTVHINHRYLFEGKGRMAVVIAKTGTALLLTTLTTIFGFASFIPSVMRAMRSTGIVLSIAMAIAFLYSVFLHPAVLIIVSEKMGLNIKPWGKK